MPRASSKVHTTVLVTVTEVHAKLGLAHLSDNKGRTWSATKSTPGIDFASLQVGDRLQVEVGEFGKDTVVHRCRKAD